MMDTLSGIKLYTCAYICFVRTKVRIDILGITVQIKIPKKKRRLVPKLYSPVIYIRTAPATPLDASIFLFLFF